MTAPVSVAGTPTTASAGRRLGRQSPGDNRRRLPAHWLRCEDEGSSEQDIGFEQSTLRLHLSLRASLVENPVKAAPWTIAWLHNNFRQEYSLHAGVCESFEGY
jgi:hypothetical protein